MFGLALPHAELEWTAGLGHEDGGSDGGSGIHFVILLEGGSLQFGPGLVVIVAITLSDFRWSPGEERSQIVHR